MRALLAATAAALSLAGCATAPGPQAVAAAPAGAPAPIQYLYGSGEAAAVSIQAWHSLVRHAGQQVRSRPVDSMVLTAGATLDRPMFEACGAKPLAAVFDVDETVLLNLGFEYDAAKGGPYSDARWAAWEKTGAGQVAPVPGALDALIALRRIGVTVIFNTNRSAANAVQTEAAINSAGLGPAKHGETLFLKGDDATGSHKDGRRARIASHYCVIAMGGDQLGDFSDLFNAGLSPAARRQAVETGPIAAMWGAGWFVLPNPVYGTALKGGVDEIFPADKRWTPPASAQEK